MFVYIIVHVLIVIYVLCDVNYFVRTVYTVLAGRLFDRKYRTDEITCFYGICTFQDCDVNFKRMRLSRIIRDLDFARFHFYDRCGIYARSKQLHVHSLQGSTLVLHFDEVPIFANYKISTKLVYWDDRSLFLEHEVITSKDGKVRGLLLSRQFALSPNGQSTQALLQGLPGFEERPPISEYIQKWLHSMEISSAKLKASQ